MPREIIKFSASFLQRKFSVALITLLFVIILAPHIDGSELGGWFISLISIIVVLVVVHAMREEKHNVIFFSVLAVINIIASFSDYLYSNYYMEITNLLLFFIFCLTATIVFYREVNGSKMITEDVLSGSICIYILIGITYGTLYIVMEKIAPGSFVNNAVNPQVRITEHFNMYYFSFITLTTVGFGDIIAVSPYARSIVIFESITGIFYLAIIVSRLVAQSRH